MSIGYTRYRHAVWCEPSLEKEIRDEQMIQSLIDFTFETAAKKNKKIAEIIISPNTGLLTAPDPKKVWLVEFFLEE